MVPCIDKDWKLKTAFSFLISGFFCLLGLKRGKLIHEKLHVVLSYTNFFHLITAFLEITSGKAKTDSGCYLKNIILLKNSGPLFTTGLSTQQSPAGDGYGWYS